MATLWLLLDSLAAIGFAAALAWGVDAVLRHAAVAPWAMLMLAAGIARGTCSVASLRAGAARSHAAKGRLRRLIIDSILRRIPGTSQGTGHAVAMAVDEIDQIDGYVTRFQPARYAASIAPLLVLFATMLASPIAAGILAATVVPFIAAMALAGGAAADQSRRQFVALARLSDLFADRLRALPVILAFGAERAATRDIAAAADELAVRTLRVLRVAFLSSAVLEFFAALSVALVAVYAGFNLLGLLPFPVPEALDLPRALFVLALAPEFYAPLRRLAAAYHDRQSAETAANRLRDAVSTSKVAEATPSTRATAPAISLRDISVRYAGTERDAVHRLDLDIAAGKTIALVGPSGSGKTSVLNCLLGLAPLTHGQVLIDGTAASPGEDIAPMAAWVGQSPLITPGTIADNIALGREGATRSQVAQAADRAGLRAMIDRRAEGLDAYLDPRGGGVSGGERRRMGLARAILKDAPVLLLDEPTAHLDGEAEADLIALIRDAIRGRTTLIATHNGALAALADQIVSLEAV
jgi:ATP-binding cassette subfamily C protein CydD